MSYHSNKSKSTKPKPTPIKKSIKFLHPMKPTLTLCRWSYKSWQVSEEIIQIRLGGNGSRNNEVIKDLIGSVEPF